MTLRIECVDGANRDRAIATALAAVRRGDLVLMPTESTYAIVTDAFSTRGVALLREVKGYDARMPLPVMVGSRTTIGGIATAVDDDARALIAAFWPGLLTLMLTPQPTLSWSLPDSVPLSVRMPLHPVALALLAATWPLVATSANAPGLPAPTDVDDAVEQLGRRISIALDAGDLSDPESLPSTVVDLTDDPGRIVRVGAVPVEALRRVCPVRFADADESDA
jgi:L-threonylcarbamoyladenylate synthase